MITMFEVGDQVRIKNTGRIGVVISYKFEKSKSNGEIQESSRYFVSFNSYTQEWCNENFLIPHHEYEFKDTFELDLLNLLIDIYLKEHKFGLVKILDGQKSKYKRG